MAHDRTLEQVRQIIGCDALIYQDVAAMKRAVGQLNPSLCGFEASCFDGVYVTGDVTSDDALRLNQNRPQGSEDDADASRLTLPNAQEG